MISMRQTGRRRYSTGTKFQCGAAIRRGLSWSVFTIFLLCVSFLFFTVQAFLT
jgi:hypothetical protein